VTSPSTLLTVLTVPTTAPGRTVHQGDALPWLRAAGTLSGASVVTSLPDSSELPALGLDGWRRWFDEAAVLTMQSVPDAGVAIFFQSDVRRAGLCPGLDRSFGCEAELIGLVVAQEPAAGSDLARNGMVTLYVAAPGAGPMDEEPAATEAAPAAEEPKASEPKA